MFVIIAFRRTRVFSIAAFGSPSCQTSQNKSLKSPAERKKRSQEKKQK